MNRVKFNSPYLKSLSLGYDHVAAFVDENDAKVGTPRNNRFQGAFERPEQDQGCNQKDGPVRVDWYSFDLRDLCQLLHF
jgi:hypothetical protein